MKNNYAITISDKFGSKHFSISADGKRKLIIAGVVALTIVAASFFGNYIQQNTVSSLAGVNKELNDELVRIDNYYSKVNQIIAAYEDQVLNISKELVSIEEFSGVDTGDLDISLEERVRLIGQFYNAKEEEYSDIGNRVENIEGIIGMDEEAIQVNGDDLSTRVVLASLTASQERILHDSIPNGYPTESHVITSKFGMRKHPVTKIQSLHKGIDLRAKTGHKVYATADGFASISDYSDLSGNRVVIAHNFGFETRYSHLDKMVVKPGEVVHKGDLIGYSGNTGRSSASHLHYEIRYLGKSIDPFQFLEWEFGSHEIFTQVRGIQWPSLISLINKQITHQTLQLSQLDPILPAK